MSRPTNLTPIARTAALILSASALAACSGMSQQEKNTAIGAGVGAIGGSVLTGGSAAGAIGGAAVGGVIGHEIDKSKK
ncbi:MAG: glycine zipper 2TM domain-containing protein [Betaproteobacteria bacterium]